MSRVSPETDLAGYPVWPDIRYGRIPGIRPDIRLNSNVEFFSEKKFVKTIFDFK